MLRFGRHVTVLFPTTETRVKEKNTYEQEGVNPSAGFQSIRNDLAALIQVMRRFDPGHVVLREMYLLH